MSYPILLSVPGMRDFAEKVDVERLRQLKKWGPQPLPDGTGHAAQIELAEVARRVCDAALADGKATHAAVLFEEVAEALAEVDPVRLKEELIQVAAVCAKWIADIDSRPATA